MQVTALSLGLHPTAHHLHYEDPVSFTVIFIVGPDLFTVDFHGERKREREREVEREKERERYRERDREKER